MCKFLRDNFMWLLMTSFVVSIATWQTTISIQEFYKYDVNTITSIKKFEQHFPSITICSLNPVFFDMKQWQNDSHLTKIYAQFEKLYTPFTDLYSLAFKYYINLSEEDKLRILPKVKDIIVECHLMSETGKKLDCINELSEFVQKESQYIVRRCALLDIPKLSNMSKEITYVYMKLSFPHSKVFVPLDPRIQIILHQCGTYPFSKYGLNQVMLSPTDYAKIAISVTEVRKLPYPYASKCIDEKTDYPCASPMSKPINKSLFGLYKYETCESMKSLTYDYYKYIVKKPFDIEKCICHLPCRYLEYDLDVQISSSILKKNMDLQKDYTKYNNLEELNKDMWTGNAVVEISPASSQIKDMFEKPKIEFNTLIGQIGGALGLWLGASIISIYLTFHYYAIKILQALHIKLK